MKIAIRKMKIDMEKSFLFLCNKIDQENVHVFCVCNALCIQ